MTKTQIGYDIDGCIVDSYPWFTIPLMQRYPKMFPEPRAFDKEGHERFYFKLQKGTDMAEFTVIIAASIAKYHHLMRHVQGAIEALSYIWCLTGDMPIFLTARHKMTDEPFKKWITKLLK